MPDTGDEIRTGSELMPSARRQNDALIVSVRGEIDLHNSPELRSAMLKLVETSAPRRVILNLQHVPYMDSSAIAVLVETLQKLRRTGGKLFLTDLQPRVKGLLEIARLDAIFVIAKDEAEALSR